MAISAKPAAGTYSLNTGHTHFPDHLYLMQEGTGTTTADDGKNAQDLPLTFGATTDVGPDWVVDGTHGPALDFVQANEDYAENNSVSGLSGTITGFVVTLLTAGTGGRIMMEWCDPSQLDRFAELVYQGDEDIESQIRFDNTLEVNASTQAGTGAYDFIGIRFSDSSCDWSLNGGAWNTFASSSAGLLASITRFVLGAKRTTSPAQYFDDTMVAAGWWRGSKSDAEWASIYNGGNIWPGMGIEPITGGGGGRRTGLVAGTRPVEIGRSGGAVFREKLKRLSSGLLVPAWA